MLPAHVLVSGGPVDLGPGSHYGLCCRYLAAVLTNQVQGGLWCRSSGYHLALAHVWWKEVHTVSICKGAAGLMASFVGQSGLDHMKTKGGGTKLRSPLTSCSAKKKVK